jgi:hypothetical protein
MALALLACTSRAETCPQGSSCYTVTQLSTQNGGAGTEPYSPTILIAQFGQIGVVSSTSPDVRVYFFCDASSPFYQKAKVIENFDIYQQQTETDVNIACNVGPMGSSWPYPIHTDVPEFTFTSNLGHKMSLSASWTAGKSRSSWIAEDATSTLVLY